MINILGFELIKLNVFMRGLVFSVSLIIVLHYGLLLVMRTVSDIRKGEWKLSPLTVLYLSLSFTAYYVLITNNFFYRVLAYILLVLYTLVVLSRAFMNWYSRTEEISGKLDRIIELLERRT